MKKFIVSYLAGLVFFSLFTPILQSIVDREYVNVWGPTLGIPIYLIYGSVPVLVGCLLGELLYRNIKRSYQLRIGIPLFILLGVSYTYLMSIVLSGGLVSNSIMSFIEFSFPIILSSLVFYFIRRIN